jgi:hypothetical protein
MPVLTPTKATGGKTKPLANVYAEAPQQISEEQLAAFMPGSGMNGAFMAELMSGMLTHERCGRHLYRSCETRTNNPILQAKYREFGTETERHVQILERLIASAGGDPGYCGAMARAVEGSDAKLLESTFMLSGSSDPMTDEMAMLDAVFLAECMDHANWTGFAALADKLPEGDLRTACLAAVDEVGPQEEEHLGWARDTKLRLASLQASSSAVATIGVKAGEIVTRIRNWLAEP